MVLIFSATGSVRGRGFGLSPRGCVAYVSGLAGFMSERAIGNAFGSTSCVGGGGFSAASTESLAEKEVYEESKNVSFVGSTFIRDGER